MKSEEGTVLIITLMILALLVTIVVEFAYGVFVGTQALYNYRDAQRLSVLAESGTSLSRSYLSGYLDGARYSMINAFPIPVQGMPGQSEDELFISINDEQARFNINSIVYPNGKTNQESMASFQRLLKALDIDEMIAHRVADWIDRDGAERVSNGEENAKNDFLYTKDELLYIRGIDEKAYHKLLPYITIYGDGMININTAPPPVIKCLSNEIDDTLAERVVDYRGYTPFEKWQDIQKVAGFDTVNLSANMITVKSKTFTIQSTAAFHGITRIIETVFTLNKKSTATHYWKES